MQFFRQGAHVVTLAIRKNTNNSAPTYLLTRLLRGKAHQMFYAVARGRNIGVYNTWDECKRQVDGFSGAKYKKFSIYDQAVDFVTENGGQLDSAPVSVSQPSSAAPKRDVTNPSSSESSKTDVLVGEFMIDSDGYVQVFTDGACGSNGRLGAKAGIGVWFRHHHALNVAEAVRGPATNNVAEIEAATRAIQIAKQAGVQKLQINTDSKFLINCITQWLPSWMKNQWKLSTGGQVKNRVQLEELSGAMKGIDVKWVHVAGHNGIEGNEQADTLARQGAAKYVIPNQTQQRYKPY